MKSLTTIKKDFPIFSQKEKKPLVYLDSSATSLKPQMVIDAITQYYTSYSANIFRGVYRMSEKATDAYEKARNTVASFIKTDDPREVVFVKNATEGINLVASSWARKVCGPEDSIVTTVMEHHANLVPWQEVSKHTGSHLEVVPVTDASQLDVLYSSITKKTKLVALTHVSNVMGVVLPLRRIISEIKKIQPSCMVLVDGAQSVPHMPVSIKEIGCDFLVFSGHKMLGPTGIGVLWGKYDILSTMDVYQTGGDMIQKVTIKESTYQDTPHRFEAGTPHIAGAIGLGAAVSYLESLGMEQVRAHEQMITTYALRELSRLPNIRILGPLDALQRGGLISFTDENIHPHDLAQILDGENICIRAGHHCAMPLHTHLGIPASARASFSVYTTTSDIDALIEGIQKAKKILT